MPPLSDLTVYPRPNVAVDIAVLTVIPRRDGEGHGALAVLVDRQRGSSSGRALPGRFLREGQTVTEAIADVLRLKVGLEGVRVTPRLLRVFDAAGRDPRGWTLSLAHSATLTPGCVEQGTGELVGIGPSGELESGETLLFDHDAIVQAAAAAMRDRYERVADPDGLLEHPFTVAELRAVHEAVLGERLLKDTFRRRMEPLLRPVTGSDGERVLRSDGGRPAQLYVRDPDRDLFAPAERRLLLPRAGS